MDFTILLILDAIILIIATIILSYFFIKDVFKKNYKSNENLKKEKLNIKNPKNNSKK